MIKRTPPHVTQKDIAQALSVSQSLVAAVLSNRSGVWVSEENRLRIRRTAQEMHYRPNVAARSLRSGRSRSVGLTVVTSSADNHVSGEIGQIITSLAGFVGAHDFDLKFKFFSTQEQILDQLAELVNTGWSEVIVLTGARDQVEAQGLLLEQVQMPFIVIGDQSERHPNWNQVDFDQEGMMALSVEHLASLGHSRIAYMGHQTTENYGRLLERGFQVAIKKSFGPNSSDMLMGRVYVEGADEPSASATDLISDWLSRPSQERPTALVFGASDDHTWREAELALLRLDLRFGDGPGEIAAAGLHYTVAPLLFGHASAFLQTDLRHMTDALCENLLIPLLEGRHPDSHFLRVCPVLQPLPSLDLGKYHF